MACNGVTFTLYHAMDLKPKLLKPVTNKIELETWENIFILTLLLPDTGRFGLL